MKLNTTIYAAVCDGKILSTRSVLILGDSAEDVQGVLDNHCGCIPHIKGIRIVPVQIIEQPGKCREWSTAEAVKRIDKVLAEDQA